MSKASSMNIDYDKTKDFERKLPCHNCNNETYHKVLCSIHKHESDNLTDIWYDYEIVMCLGCKEISFRSNWVFSEEFEYDDEREFIPINHQDLFPNRILGRKELEDSKLLPFNIQKIYKEAYIALVNKAPILAGVGIRALLEAICKDKETTGGDLEKRIDNLVTLKVLTEEGAEVLHSTRIMGNNAAHELTAFDETDLEVAMSLLEHVLLGVYILPKKAKSLPKRVKGV